MAEKMMPYALRMTLAVLANKPGDARNISAECVTAMTKELMGVAKADAMVLHCLPAYREQEITTEVFEAHANEIFGEAESRLHAQKAVLVKLLG